jgi:hypothetical protein
LGAEGGLDPAADLLVLLGDLPSDRVQGAVGEED